MGRIGGRHDRHGFTVIEVVVTVTLLALVLGVRDRHHDRRDAVARPLRRADRAGRSRARDRPLRVEGRAPFVLGDAERHRVRRDRRGAGDDGEIGDDARPRRPGRRLLARPGGADPFDVRHPCDLGHDVDGRVDRRHACSSRPAGHRERAVPSTSRPRPLRAAAPIIRSRSTSLAGRRSSRDRAVTAGAPAPRRRRRSQHRARRARAAPGAECATAW